MEMEKPEFNLSSGATATKRGEFKIHPATTEYSGDYEVAIFASQWNVCPLP
jgi:hypothetical protein